MLASLSNPGAAAEPVTLENVVDPGPNRLDEPRAKAYSLEAATRFLDSAALMWQKQRKCFTCHTNYAYLYVRPSVSSDAPAHGEVRKFAEDLVRERWAEKGPRWDAEVVATAAALAFNDAATTGKLHPLTRQALDRMWTVQREDGGWDWIKCDWPPMESDDYYGGVLAALAAGVAPDSYAQTDAARTGLEKLRKYLRANPPPSVHHEAMLLWASTYLGDLMSEADRTAAARRLWELQQADGGWALASLGKWKREDGSPQDTKTSDGYATGLAVYVLRRAGTTADDSRIQKAVAWLKQNQRESGRWVARSLFRDNHHFISHAATAFAVMAIQSCETAKGAE
jgi:squalene-hopene/tetraprenyl-beta-curcumene cyclase